MRVRAALIALAMVVAAGAALLPRRAPQEPDVPLRLPALHDLTEIPDVGFVRPGRRLVLASEISSRPVFLSLYLVIGDEARPIGNPDELVGHVSIDTEQSAMHYARLFTRFSISPDTAPEWQCEVLLEGDSEFAEHYDSEDTARLKSLSMYPREALWEKDWQSNHLSLPSTRRVGDAVVVERYLLAKKDLHHLEASTIYRVQETVYSDGRMIRKNLKRQELSGVTIHVPGRM